jgi:hypothetical protein
MRRGGGRDHAATPSLHHVPLGVARGLPPLCGRHGESGVMPRFAADQPKACPSDIEGFHAKRSHLATQKTLRNSGLGRFPRRNWDGDYRKWDHPLNLAPQIIPLRKHGRPRRRRRAPRRGVRFPHVPRVFHRKNHRQHDQDQQGAIGDGKRHFARFHTAENIDGGTAMAGRDKEDHGGNSSHGMDKAEGEYRNPDDSYEYPKAPS